VLITVKEGTASWYDADCNLHLYTAGMAFIEDAGAIHNVRNESSIQVAIQMSGSPAVGEYSWGSCCLVRVDNLTSARIQVKTHQRYRIPACLVTLTRVV